MKSKKTLIIGIVIVIVVLGCAAALVGSQQIAAAQATAQSTALPPVTSGGEVIADGQVVPWQDAALSFATGGRVEEVLVQEGELIQQGQLIAQLNGREQAEAAIAAAKLELLSAQQALETLRRNAPLAAAQAKLDMENSRKQEEDAKEGVHKNNAEAAKAKLDKAREWLAAAEARYYYLLAKNDTSASGQYALQQAYEEYIHALQAVQEAQAEYDAIVASNGGYGVPDSLDSDISKAEYDAAVARRKEAEDRYNRLKDGPDKDALALAEARVYSAECQLAVAEAGLRALELHAPFTGTVVAMELKQGQSVNPGVAVVTLANLNVWRVETTDLSEIDVTKIAIGDPVTVTFDALPGLELTGKVISISELGVNRQGEITYKVVIVLDKLDSKLRWNMTAMAKIK